MAVLEQSGEGEKRETWYSVAHEWTLGVAIIFFLNIDSILFSKKQEESYGGLDGGLELYGNIVFTKLQF